MELTQEKLKEILRLHNVWCDTELVPYYDEENGCNIFNDRCENTDIVLELEARSLQMRHEDIARFLISNLVDKKLYNEITMCESQIDLQKIMRENLIKFCKEKCLNFLIRI